MRRLKAEASLSVSTQPWPWNSAPSVSATRFLCGAWQLVTGVVVHGCVCVSMCVCAVWVQTNLGTSWTLLAPIRRRKPINLALSSVLGVCKLRVHVIICMNKLDYSYLSCVCARMYYVWGGVVYGAWCVMCVCMWMCVVILTLQFAPHSMSLLIYIYIYILHIPCPSYIYVYRLNIYIYY